MTMTQILIIGGGAAGTTVAASMRRKNKNVHITIVDPAEHHYYQPAFTLVGGGVYDFAKTKRSRSSLIPNGVKWVQDAAASFDPKKNEVTLQSGDVLAYDYLVVCPGLVCAWDRVKGLKDALGKRGVCSNYSSEHVNYTWDCVQNVQKGDKILFTQPPMPIKCPGAPQKIAYLVADYLRKKGWLEECDLHFMTQTPAIFGVPYFARALEKVMDRYGIQKHYQTNLTSVDGEKKQAVFEDADGKKHAFEYDMLHVTPPQIAPECVAKSPLANEAGWVDVNQHSLQHVKFSNVFGLGDACSTPNSKTAAAIRKQAPVVVRNILHMIKGQSVEELYDGYASCPLTTSYGKVLMAEFIYGGKVTPTFSFLTPAKEFSVYWWVKATGLPLMYWHYMLKGREWFFKHKTDYVAEEEAAVIVAEAAEKQEKPKRKKAA